jgi:hypothetical protein
MEKGDELRATILFKLMRKRKWGESHIPLDRVIRLVPSHLRGETKKIIQDLKRENLILSKPTHYGEEISLNPKQVEVIYSIVKKYFSVELL